MRILFLTSQSLITQHWPAVGELLQPVLRAAKGEFDIEDLEELCRDGRAVAGAVFDEGGRMVLALVFEFLLFPQISTVNVIALAGHDMDEAAATFWPTFREWAKESGASHIQASTSPAMSRLLRPLGFRHTYDLVRAPC